MRFAVCFSVLFPMLLGCSQPKQTGEVPNPPAVVGAAPTASAQPGPVTDKSLAKFKQEHDLAKLGYTKDPASKTAKDTYVFTTVRLGLATMDAGNTQDPKVKYPAALRLFREALKVDPANADAKQNKDLIESIYKSMHRPIPQ